MCPEVKKALWGGAFWTRGYYVGTVWEHGDEQVISRYVKNQGRSPDEYEKTYLALVHLVAVFVSLAISRLWGHALGRVHAKEKDTNTDPKSSGKVHFRVPGVQKNDKYLVWYVTSGYKHSISSLFF